MGQWAIGRVESEKEREKLEREGKHIGSISAARLACVRVFFFVIVYW